MGRGAVGGLVNQEKVAGGVGLYYIKIFFFSNVIIIYYIIQETRGR